VIYILLSRGFYEPALCGTLHIWSVAHCATGVPRYGYVLDNCMAHLRGIDASSLGRSVPIRVCECRTLSLSGPQRIGGGEGGPHQRFDFGLIDESIDRSLIETRRRAMASPQLINPYHATRRAWEGEREIYLYPHFRSASADDSRSRGNG